MRWVGKYAGIRLKPHISQIQNMAHQSGKATTLPNNQKAILQSISSTAWSPCQAI